MTSVKKKYTKSKQIHTTIPTLHSIPNDVTIHCIHYKTFQNVQYLSLVHQSTHQPTKKQVHTNLYKPQSDPFPICKQKNVKNLFTPLFLKLQNFFSRILYFPEDLTTKRKQTILQ